MEIPARTRRHLVDWLLQRTDLFSDPDSTLRILDHVWDLRHRQPTNEHRANLYEELRLEMDSWLSAEDALYGRIGVTLVPDSEFIEFLERCVHPLATAQSEDVQAIVADLNSILGQAGLELQSSHRIANGDVYEVREVAGAAPREEPATPRGLWASTALGDDVTPQEPAAYQRERTELSETQRALLRAAYQKGREGELLNLRDWAQETGTDTGEMSDSLESLMEVGWLGPGAMGAAEITGAGVLASEELGLTEADLTAADVLLRTDILTTVYRLRKDRSRNDWLSWQEVEKALGDADRRALDFNRSVLVETDHLSLDGPGEVELTELGAAAVEDYVHRNSVADLVRAGAEASAPDRGALARQVFQELAGREGWEILREERGRQVYRAGVTYYLVECTWTEAPPDAAAVRPMRAHLQQNPALRGVILSMSGFAEEARKLLAGIATRQPIAGLDMSDVEAIVSGEADLSERISAIMDDGIRTVPIAEGLRTVASALDFPLDPAEIEPKRDRVFVAHPFADPFPVTDFRRSVDGVLKACDLAADYADQELTSAHILKKICRLIQECRFGIYDLTGWNANVALELGLAIGLQRPMVLLLDTRQSSDMPADLRGLDHIQYRSMSQLEQELQRKLPGFSEGCGP